MLAAAGRGLAARARGVRADIVETPFWAQFSLIIGGAVMLSVVLLLMAVAAYQSGVRFAAID